MPQSWAALVPPYWVPTVPAGKPSICAVPPVTLIGAVPSSTSPPQSPGRREPSGCELVMTTGAAAVPRTSILPLVVTTKDEPLSPRILVPASMTSVPERTKMCVFST